MAQTEDTELRDIVIDALEKNGSLAKIRALLRANIFLAFEDERDNIKQNANLDNIIKLPEGVLSLSIVHEFLEFCNLKNTLFVYMSESRQGKDYNYDGKKALIDKINVIKQDMKEPVLITLIKTLFNYQHSPESHGDTIKYTEKNSDNNLKDEQNCTYIVHEDSQSSTTNSNSDNSSDEKNKLQLRLQLDNSDTDTSSDSARDKSGSEYITNNFLPSKNENSQSYKEQKSLKENKDNNDQKQNNKSELIQETKVITSSSDSTSYVDIKSFNLSNEMLNSAIPKNVDEKKLDKTISQSAIQQAGVELDRSPTLSNISSLSQKNANTEKSNSSGNKSSTRCAKSDLESAEYSYDFSSSPKKKDAPEHHTKNSQPDITPSPRKTNVHESQNHSPESSRSSISISDVADLISDRSSNRHMKSGRSVSNNKSNLSLKNAEHYSKILSDNSGEFTESPIPSLSNLSLDIHSD
ncbi:hypothetical protein K1T71_003183 [Dendrolimus kikuchii]|uniref:Uncharacterized protein n=1 Tax=Dendrolimus kikuchii TaxID=765133 RepID=A0ACC1DAZ7_9NEOP|nr:hypothetical protein K1T71_003183 [Dendrolimus kikuchii]